MNYDIFIATTVFIEVFGMLAAFFMGVKFRDRYATRFWIEVAPEYEFHVIKAIQMMDLCKKSVVYALPSISVGKDGKLREVAPTTTIVVELGLRWFARARQSRSGDDQQSNGSITREILARIVRGIESQDLLVLNSGVY